MLYYLFNYLREQFDLSGAGLFQYITFRAGLAILLSLVITMVFGKVLIQFLKKKQIGETVRDLGLEGENAKQGTPTMGGLIIIAGILIPTLLFAQVHNIYIIMMILATVWLGIIGFIDDYIKVFKKDKDGLKGRFKVLGQVGLGCIIGITMFYHQDIVTSKKVEVGVEITDSDREKIVSGPIKHMNEKGEEQTYVRVHSPVTSIPFLKGHEFNYSAVAAIFGTNAVKWMTPIIYILFVIFIITAVSNGVNLTDGIDGLATGTSAIAGAGFGVFAYLSGNYIFANYLNIMHIPNLGELTIFIAAFVGACVGFLWYNAYPAQVFMGDTGSLALGGIIAALAIIVRKELLIPIVCGVFLVENVSVIMQVAYFKHTKRKYGEGKRLMKMAPLHHHYQLLGYHESKIVTRFWIIAILLVVLSVISMKIQ